MTTEPGKEETGGASETMSPSESRRVRSYRIGIAIAAAVVAALVFADAMPELFGRQTYLSVDAASVIFGTALLALIFCWIWSRLATGKPMSFVFIFVASLGAASGVAMIADTVLGLFGLTGVLKSVGIYVATAVAGILFFLSGRFNLKARSKDRDP